MAIASGSWPSRTSRSWACARGLRVALLTRLRADSDLTRCGSAPPLAWKRWNRARNPERLERIDSLQREDAPARAVLAEVRSLLSDAERWVREDPSVPPEAAAALERSRAAVTAGESRAETVLAIP